jgi:KDO2-lipid IV(A) lauroyltransferase
MQKPERFRAKPIRQHDSSRAASDQPRRARADVRKLLAAAPATVFARCLGPRHWPTWLFVLWLRLTALLPWRFALKLHKALGRAAGKLFTRRRRIVRRNLEICFPALDAAQLDAVVQRHFASVGAFFAELAVAWFGKSERRAHLFRIEGVEHLRNAVAKGKGVLLYSGHFTTLEICAPMVKPLVPLYAFMYRQRRDPLLNIFQTRGRSRYAHVSVAADDVREMLALLARNAVVWYAPDQARIDSGELVPFFGEPAMTSTAPSRLARLSGAAIIPLFFCRLPDDSGYLMRFHAPLDDLPSRDTMRDTVRLTAVLESFIRECPEQYFWTHRKFKHRTGESDAYGGGAA